MAKVKEIKPMVIERRKVSIPHYDLGGFVGGLFSGLASDMTTQNQYQAQLAPTMQTNYGGMINNAGTNALSGYGNFNANQGQQQDLANALKGVAGGQGPNPAQAMLNQSTGANVANQAALMAGQRGSGANAGMIARQAAMAGSNAQQQAAGQAATLQAQQSLGAMGQQGQLLGQMGQQNLGEQGVNAGLFNSAAGAQNAQNNSTIQNYGMMQGINSGVAQNNTNAVNTTMGGLMNGIGGAAGMAFGKPPAAPVNRAHGGMIGMACGGMVDEPMRHIHSIYHADGGEISPESDDIFQDTTRAIYRARSQNLGATNDMNVSSVGYQPRENKVDGMEISAVGDYRDGGRVPGVAPVAGDSLKNDIQPAMLSPKEIVIPRSITMAPDAPEKAKEFVEALLKKQGHGNSKHHKEFHKALKEAILSRKDRGGK